MALPRIGFIGCGPFSTGSIYPRLQALAFGLAPDAVLQLAVRGDRAHARPRRRPGASALAGAPSWSPAATRRRSWRGATRARSASSAG